jgi:hypothetical protein
MFQQRNLKLFQYVPVRHVNLPMTDQAAAQIYVQSDAPTVWSSGYGKDVPTQK